MNVWDNGDHDSGGLGMVEIDWLIELIIYCDTATEGCVSNDFFRHSLDDKLTTRHLIWHSCPSLNTVELIVIHNRSCEHSSNLQLSIRFTPSRCLDVWQDWYPMYYPEGMKARVSPVQSIKPNRLKPGTSGSTVLSSNHYTTAAHMSLERRMRRRVNAKKYFQAPPQSQGGG